MTENRRVFLNIVVTYGRSLYGLVLGLLCGRWAFLALGEIDYGLNGLVAGLTVFIAFFNSVLAGANARYYAFSIGAAKAAEDKAAALEECRRWFNTALSVHAVVPLVLILIGYPVGTYAIEHWLTIPADRVEACVWVFRFVCISCFVSMVNVPFSAMYGAKQYIAELTVYSFVTSTLNVVALYYMVSHPGVWLTRYAAWTCFLSVAPQIVISLRALVVFPECRINFAYMGDRARLKSLGVYSGWQFIGCLCGLLRYNGISIVINKFFGAAMNAAQAVGNTIQGQCNTLAGAMQGAFTPVITQACGAGDYEKMKRFALRTCKFNIALYAVFAMPAALEIDEVLILWLKNPPAYAGGLCLCAMAMYMVNACTIGHMIVVNATGRIAAYHVVLGAISVLTLPLAIAAGFVWRNVYAVMGALIVMECLNSIGRLLFARLLAGMGIGPWVQSVAFRGALVIGLSLVLGALVRILCAPSFYRVCLTTVMCEAVYLPLFWFFLLSKDERDFVVEKCRPRVKRLIGKHSAA